MSLINSATLDSILDFFDFEPAPASIADLDTPVPIIDLGVVMHNMQKAQSHHDQLGISFRPHIKTHKMIPLAKAQVHLGAHGITTQKLGEAEIMADAGLEDILISYNILGATKLQRLANLARKCNLTLTADNIECVQQLDETAQGRGIRFNVLIECDTGGNRAGTQSPDETLQLAQAIQSSSNLAFKGLLTYSPAERREDAAFRLNAVKHTLVSHGINPKIISSGGTRDLHSSAGLQDVTEYRAGTYIFNDRMVLADGACTLDDCAVRILATVVSSPHGTGRVIIDAGSKALTSDLGGLEGFGIEPSSQAKLYNVNEEHGFLEATGSASSLKVGGQVQILPNHVCPVINLYDKVIFTLDGQVLGFVKVDCRGRVT